MIGLILSGLLACAHGLGDTQPYTNAGTQGYTPALLAAAEWQADMCITGTKQSPIDIVSTAAIVTKPDVGAIMATGFDSDRPVNWMVGGSVGSVPSTTGVEVTAANQPAYITGGPLDDQRLVHLKIIFIVVFLTSFLQLSVLPHRVPLGCCYWRFGKRAFNGWDKGSHGDVFCPLQDKLPYQCSNLCCQQRNWL